METPPVPLCQINRLVKIFQSLLQIGPIDTGHTQSLLQLPFCEFDGALLRFVGVNTGQVHIHDLEFRKGQIGAPQLE